MPTSAPGSDAPAPLTLRAARAAGFTLIELLVVVAIIAIATAGVAFALRDSGATRLEREGERLAALFEAARAQSRGSGVPVAWQAIPGGFRFEGLPANALPGAWLSPDTVVQGTARVQLGPEPVIPPQAVLLASPAAPGRLLRVATDGLRPFTVGEAPPP